MQWRNTNDRFGLVTGSLHWLMALAVIGLTALGLWMTSLTYYSPYYTSAPFWHKSIGLVFAALLVLRLIWRAATPSLRMWRVTSAGSGVWRPGRSG